ncbi:MAG: hypothetical protein D6722_21440 [Bacteroidetes bacterium]|nr:MAG: hypothetical protein D6722_21440 [Bacteroidota bacterium]
MKWPQAPSFHRLSLWILLLTTLVVACQRPDDRTLLPAPDPSQTIDFGDLTLAPKAIAFDSLSQAALVQVVEDSILHFLQPKSQLLRLDTGSILMIPPGPQAPYGLLRKVTAIDRQGDQLSLITAPAQLTEAIESGSVLVDKEIGPGDIVSEVLADGVERGDSTGRLAATGLVYEVERPFVMPDGRTLTFSGTVYLDPRVHAYVDFGYFSLEEAALWIDLKQGMELEMSYTDNLVNWKKEIDLASITLAPIMAGPIPITPVIEVELEITTTVEGGFSASIHYELTARAGVTHRQDQWTPVWDRDLTGDFDLRPTLALESRVALSPEIEFKIFNLASVEIEGLKPYVKATYDPFATPCWEAFGGVDFSMEFEAEVFGQEEDYAWPLPSYQLEIASGACFNPGTLAGMVLDALTSQPVAGVTVAVSDQGTETGLGTTDANGQYNFQVPAGDNLTVTFSKPGYLPVEYVQVEVSPFQQTYLEGILQIEESLAGTGGAGGQIRDALSGSGLDGVSLQVRKGVNQNQGPIIASGSTDVAGNYSFQDLEAGHYTVEASRTNYITGYFTLMVIGNQSTGSQNGSLTPELPAGQVRIVLTWGADPSDLDSHLTGPLPGSSDRFHVYYGNMAPNGAGASLDLDDVSSYGPETITITEQRLGVYRYSVHDFTNRSYSPSSALAQSNAKVRVFVGSSELGTFNVPNQPGTLWTVFEMDEDTFTPINEMSYESSPGSVRNGVTTDGPLLLRLPPK